jgi:iron complex outermembrane receptor protein
MMEKIKEIIDLLHDNGYSCVIANNDETRVFYSRGVKDLYDLFKNTDFLKGAFVADKVVGKAAASLMILGGVKEVYTDLISTPALQMLKENCIEASYHTEVPVILNGSQNDWCPLEILCNQENLPENLLPSIENFIKNIPVSTEAITPDK